MERGQDSNLEEPSGLEGTVRVVVQKGLVGQDSFQLDALPVALRRHLEPLFVLLADMGLC